MLGGQRTGPGRDDWKWLDGTEWKFTKWNPRQPDNAGGRETVLQCYAHGNWNDINPGWRCRAVYKRGGGKSKKAFGKPFSGDDPIVYMINKEILNLQQHEAKAKQWGGHVSSVANWEELNLIRSLVNNQEWVYCVISLTSATAFSSLVPRLSSLVRTFR